MDSWFEDRGKSESLMRESMASRSVNGPHSEEELSNILRILFDEIDLKKELMEEFVCERVVEYILTLFDEGMIREMLFKILYYDDVTLWPMSVFIRMEKIPVDSKLEILRKIAQIYLDNSMRNEYRATRSTYWDVKYETHKKLLMCFKNDFYLS